MIMIVQKPIKASAPGEEIMHPEDRSLTAHGKGPDKDRWQALIDRLGLDLQLPSNGFLCRPWCDFLEQLEDRATGPGNEKGARP